MDVEAFYNKYRRYVFSVCYSLTKNRYDADDLTQQVFMVAMKKQPVGNQNQMQTWLYRTAYFEFLRMRTKNKKYVSIGDMDWTIEYHERDLEDIDTGRFKKRTVGFISDICNRLTAQFAQPAKIQ